MHFGLYHSQYEWFHPLFLQDKANNLTTQDFVKVKECCFNQIFNKVEYPGYKIEVWWTAILDRGFSDNRFNFNWQTIIKGLK